MSMRPEDYIIGYLDIRRIEQALEEARYEWIPEEIDAAMKKIAAEDAAGELDQSLEFYVSCLMAELGTLFYFYETGTLGISAAVYHRDFVEMRKDYEQWKKDRTFGRRQWMYPRDEEEGVSWETDEDGYVIEDMLADCWFSALDAFGIPIGIYDSCPEDIKKSRCERSYRGGEMRIDPRITDDGGLCSCEDPTGLDFELTDEDGVRYHLKHLEKDLLAMSFLGKDDARRVYKAAGWIEGYTAPEEREISLTIFPDGHLAIFFDPMPGDEETRENDPRWKEYYRWKKEHDAVNDRWRQEHLDKYRA